METRELILFKQIYLNGPKNVLMNLIREELGVMAMKVYFSLSKYPELDPPNL